MLLQKSRPFKGRLARSPLTKDVLIIFTAAEIKKIDMFPFTAQPQATEFATTKQKSILPHDTVFLGGWKPHSPHPKKVVPQQTLRLKRRLDNCYFCSSVRYEASLVQSLQTLEQKSKCRIEKKETQPVATEPGKGKGQWEERGAEDSSGRLTVCFSLFGFMQTPRFPHEAPWHSPCFLSFCDFQKQISGLCLIWGKHCVSASSAFAPGAARRCVECPLLAEWETPTNTLNTG